MRSVLNSLVMASLPSMSSRTCFSKGLAISAMQMTTKDPTHGVPRPLAASPSWARGAYKVLPDGSLTRFDLGA